MNLVLARLAESPRPDPDELLYVLRGRDWLTHRPGDPRSPDGAFLYPGGGVHPVYKTNGRPYTAPWLHVWLNREVRFDWIAPRLVALAGTLGLGLREELLCPWWPAPAPSELPPARLERAIALCSRCEIWEAWGLLGVSLADDACLELAESNPALAYALATTRELHGRKVPSRERHVLVRALARRPRREILSALGCPPTRSMLRLFAKLPIESLSPSAVSVLSRGRIPEDALRILRHVPRLNYGCLSLVGPVLWPHVGGRLLQEAAEHGDEYEDVLLRDCLDMARRMRRPERVGIVRSREELKQLDRRLSEEYLQWQLRGAGVGEASGPLVPPPLAGNDDVVPLSTVEDLIAEAREMENCVASYAPRVRAGECFVYRVLRPERATVAIRWDRSGEWTIAQLRGPSNAAVRPETEAAVNRWLDGG